MARLYTAEATAYGPRTGAVISSDDRLDLELSRPVEMGGEGGDGTNPEQLFAAGYAACFHSAMRHAVADQRLGPESLTGAHVTARVHFDKAGPREFDLAVDLLVHLPRIPREQAEAVVEATHQICPYSRATRGNVAVSLQVV